MPLEAGQPVALEHIDPFVDGAAVRKVGRITHAIAAAEPPRMLAVPEGRICSEMLDLYQTDGIISEPAGALAASSLGPDRGLPEDATVGACSPAATTT